MYHCDDLDPGTVEEKENHSTVQLTPYATGVPTEDPLHPFNPSSTTTRKPSGNAGSAGNAGNAGTAVLNFLGGLVSSAIQSAGK